MGISQAPPSIAEGLQFALEVEHVTKRFGDFTAVSDLSMRVPTGSIYGFLGPNGSGKTTTMRMIMSIFYPDEGQIRVLGAEDAAQVKDRLGYLPEEKGLYKKMKVREIVAYFGRLKGLSKEEAYGRATELLSKYGLGDWLDTRCEALSKGMGQKVQLLGTLVHDPDLVILDEPFSGLDPINMELMRDTILDLKKQGKTVLFSTHVMAQAEEICDSILLIYKGKAKLDGPLAKIRAGGHRAIRLEFEGDASFLRDDPQVDHVNMTPNSAEVFLKTEADPQDFLRSLLGKLRIRRFDMRDPSLHEIYVRTIGPEAAKEFGHV
ncbi:MAG TPA: ATP-binding cassette domain-containing protein [Planctomycetes bacterium]|nr:ATP-binding cassette domain-containing protein [Planctomycetota bacterium]